MVKNNSHPVAQVSLSGALVITIVVLALIMTHMQQVDTALPYVLWSIGGVTGLVILYFGYKAWHSVRSMSIDHKERKYHVSIIAEEAESRRASRELMQETRLLMQEARKAGMSVNMEYANDGTVKRIQTLAAARTPRTTVEEIAGPVEIPQLQSPLPTSVLYEDVRNQVPAGHVLVGMGRAGLETKEASAGACLWIVGASGTGKTSTTVLRVEERYAAGHKFMGCDPHWFKPDSLTNAITSYEHAFVHPMARDPQEMKQVLAAFLAEFRARKAGQIAQPWQPITLLVDEVGALMDPADEDEEEIAKMLKSIARICGQEARNFKMGGIFISQQATELSWLRKVALMIIVHQLNMESEKKIALQNDREAIEDMKRWPVGRTYVYGIGFQEGPRTVQQPYYGGRVVEADPPRISRRSQSLADLPYKTSRAQSGALNVSHGYRSGSLGNSLETPSQGLVETASDEQLDIIDDVFGNDVTLADPVNVEKNDLPVSTEKLETIKRMKKSQMADREIAKLVGLAGRKYGQYQAALAYLLEEGTR